MRTVKSLVILVLAVMVWTVIVVEATPMSTAFTYQGRLLDDNRPADGLYDFQFRLYDDPNVIIGIQIGETLELNELDVIDGYFTVELDFGIGVFDGNARWLEIGVRRGELNDPNEYTVLLPRQELTPVPYALYSETAGRIYANSPDNDWIISENNMYSAVSGNVGIGTTSPGAKLQINSTSDFILRLQKSSLGENITMIDLRNALGDSKMNINLTADDIPVFYSRAGAGWALSIALNNGNVGIGTTSPTARLEVNGQLKINGGAPGAGKVLTSDATGLASWQTPAADNDWTVFGNSMYSAVSGNVGIGTANPVYKLDVDGNIRATGVIMGTVADADRVDGYDAGNSSGQVAVSNGNLCVNLNADKLDGQNGSYYRNWNNLTNVPPGFADGTDDVGALILPYDGVVSTSGTAFSVVNQGSGDASAIYGSADNSGNYANIGGWFVAKGSEGTGVYGYASGVEGQGVCGFADDWSVATTNYGGYFKAHGGQGCGVYGEASNTAGQNYGGHFVARGTTGRGVLGSAVGSGWDPTYGVYGEAQSTNGRGVAGYATGARGVGVLGWGRFYDFYAEGPGQNYGAASSIRWKTNIQPIDDPLGKVIRLRGVYFDWDEEHGGQHDVGMIAEEVGEVLPEIVGYEENGVYATGMDYSKLTPLLIEAVKELKRQGDERQKELAKKDVEIAELKARLTKLETVVSKLMLSEK